MNLTSAPKNKCKNLTSQTQVGSFNIHEAMIPETFGNEQGE